MTDDEYDCESCTRRVLFEGLGAEDHVALALYEQLSHPVVQELGLVDVVFDAMGLQMTRVEISVLLRRLQVIHENTLSRREAAQTTTDG